MQKNIIRITLVTLSTTFVFTFFNIFPSVAKKDIVSSQFNSQANYYTNWNPTNTAPQWVRSNNLDTEWQSENNSEKAYEFLENNSDIYRLREPRKLFEISSKYSDELSMQHVSLLQKYHDIPVYGAELKFHFKPDGALSSVNGSYSNNFSNVDTIPTISANDAIKIAKDKLQASLSSQILAEPELQIANHGIYIYDRSLFTKRPDKVYLIYILLTSPT